MYCLWNQQKHRYQCFCCQWAEILLRSSYMFLVHAATSGHVNFLSLCFLQGLLSLPMTMLMSVIWFTMECHMDVCDLCCCPMPLFYIFWLCCHQRPFGCSWYRLSLETMGKFIICASKNCKGQERIVSLISMNADS